MRICTWNINGLANITTESLGSLLESADVMVLQEVRASASALGSRIADDAIEISVSVGSSPGRGGVATLSRIPVVDQWVEPIATGDPVGRSLLTVYQGFAVLNIYVPHGRRDARDLPLKLRFLYEVATFAERWAGPPLLIAGDMNVAIAPIDCARPEQNSRSVMFRPEVRAALRKLLDAGYIDAVRARHNGVSGLYTWWPYAFNARERNLGWRLDYVFAPRDIAIHDANHLSDTIGSDHCPALVDLRLGEIISE